MHGLSILLLVMAYVFITVGTHLSWNCGTQYASLGFWNICLLTHQTNKELRLKKSALERLMIAWCCNTTGAMCIIGISYFAHEIDFQAAALLSVVFSVGSTVLTHWNFHRGAEQRSVFRGIPTTG